MDSPTAKAHARLVSAMSDLHDELTDTQGDDRDAAMYLRRAEGGE